LCSLDLSLALRKPGVMMNFSKASKKMTRLALFDHPIVGWALGGLVVILLNRDLINNWIDNQQLALECSDGDYKGYSLITYPSLADEDGRIKVLEFSNCSDKSKVYENPIFTEDAIYFVEGGGWIDRKTLTTSMDEQCKAIEVGEAIRRARAEDRCVEEKPQENRI